MQPIAILCVGLHRRPTPPRSCHAQFWAFSRNFYHPESPPYSSRSFSALWLVCFSDSLVLLSRFNVYPPLPTLSLIALELECASEWFFLLQNCSHQDTIEAIGRKVIPFIATLLHPTPLGPLWRLLMSVMSWSVPSWYKRWFSEHLKWANLQKKPTLLWTMTQANTVLWSSCTKWPFRWCKHVCVCVCVCVCVECAE